MDLMISISLEVENNTEENGEDQSEDKKEDGEKKSDEQADSGVGSPNSKDAPTSTGQQEDPPKPAVSMESAEVQTTPKKEQKQKDNKETEAKPAQRPTIEKGEESW